MTAALTGDEEERDDSANSLSPIALREDNLTVMTGPDCAAPPLAIRLFGPFEVRLNGAPLPRLRSRKVQWLLALLTLRHEATVERAWLAGLLWPDAPESQAMVSLRSSLADLRRALGSEAGRLRSPSLHALSLDLSGAQVDLVAFDQTIARGDLASLEQAIALYRGPLLEGCAEEWAFAERQVREQAYLAALERLAAPAIERGELAAAERCLRLAVGVDPLRESAQRALMQALAAGSNTTAAAQVYQDLRRLLHRELNAEPDPETQALFQQLRAGYPRSGWTREKARATDRAGTRAAGDEGSRGEPVEPALASLPTDHRPLPTGTVTFLLTDIEGSTKLWLDDPAAMREALARHDALAAAIIQQHDGLLIKQRGEGDSLFAVFPRATDAVAAALDLQRALQDLRFLVRMALHTGEAELREEDYFGLAVNHCARLRAVGHGGQILLSQTTAALTRDELPAGASLRELGAHRLKDLQRAEPLFQLVHPDLLANDFPALSSLEAFAHNLPVQWTSFIGREDQMAEVKRLLQSTHLLTLTGTGGCGKTRLALQVASDLVAEFADGVWLVELAALADPALVPQVVASALEVREEPGRPLRETLAGSLRARSLLLVLDNCEHLLPACAGLAETLLQRCGNLRLLATSREGLRIAGETTYPVPPLSLPDSKRLPPLAMLTQFEATRLFVERATAAQPAFTVTEQNAAAVAQVCHRLDGIPLAIELAAARVKALTVEKIAERVKDHFLLLTGGSRTALPRHQTLQALIDWSYALLAEPERVLLRRLSVFAGGWTLEAAEAVVSGQWSVVSPATSKTASPPPVSLSELPTVHCLLPTDVIDLLSSLVEKSLVGYEAPPPTSGEYPGHAQPGGDEARYRLLETVRQYARERLSESGEEEAVRGRHRDWFVTLAEQADRELEGAHQQEWLERLDREHDNLRAALESGWEADPASALRLAAALGWFWQIRGPLSEGREALERGLQHGVGAPDEVRWKALDWAGEIAWRQGENERAIELFEACLALSRELGDRRGIGRSLNMLGVMAENRGDYRLARALYEENLPLWRELDDQLRLTYSLNNLGTLAQKQGDDAAARALYGEALEITRAIGNRRFQARYLTNLGWLAQHQGDDEAARACFEESLAISREIGARDSLATALHGLGCLACSEGQFEAARRFLEESLAISRELGDKGLIAGSLNNLGWAARGQGDWEAAQTLHEESLAISTKIGDKSLMGWALQGLGDVAFAQGEYGQARAVFRESLAIWRELGKERETAEGLERLASVAGAEGDVERAARLFGAAEALREAIGSPVRPVERAEYDRSVTASRARSDEAAFAAAWAEGRTMPLEQAVTYAMEEAGPEA